MKSGAEDPNEARLLVEIRLALARRYPDLVLWRNSVGCAMIAGRYQSFGLCRGSSDLIGIYRGRFVAFEVKTPRGRPSAAQQRFIDLVRSHGGLAAVVRSVGDAIAAIDGAPDAM